MKIIADENIKLKLVKFLIHKGHDIDIITKGFDDNGLFSLACKEKRIILTHDKHFLNTSLFPPKQSVGIILLRIHPPELQKLENALIKLFNEFNEKEINGKLLILGENSIEILS